MNIFEIFGSIEVKTDKLESNMRKVDQVLDKVEDNLHNATTAGGKLGKGLSGTVAGGFEKARSGASRLVGGLKNFLASIGVLALVQKGISLVTGAIDSAISRVDTMRNFPKVMANFGIGTDVAKSAINKLSTALDGLPTTLDAAALGVQRITSSTGDVDKATDIFLALNNAVLAGGAPMENQASAMEQFMQSFAKGKPDMMEWRALLSVMPAQVNQIAQAMGYGAEGATQLGEDLRLGKIPMSDFTDALIKLNEEGVEGFPAFAEQAKNASGGIRNSMSLIATAVTRGLANVLIAIDDTAQNNNLPTIGEMFTSVRDRINAAFSVIGEAVGLVGDKIKAFSDSEAGQRMSEQLGSLSQAFGSFDGKGAFMTIIGALTDFALGAGATVIAIIDGVRQGAENFNNSPAGKQLADTIQSISDKFSALSTGDGPTLAGFLSTLGTVFSGIAQGIGYAVLGIMTAIDATWGFIQNTLIPGIQATIDGIRGGIDTVKGVIQTLGDNLYWIAPVLGTITALIVAYNASTIAANATGLVWKATLLGIKIALAAEAGINAVITAAKIAYTAATGAATVATTAFGTALKFAMGPVGLIILAIGGIVTVVMLVIKHWDVIKAKAIEVFGAIVEFLSPVIEAIKGFFTGIAEAVSNAWDSIVNFFTVTLPAAGQSVIDFFAGLPQMILDALASLGGMIVGFFGNVPGWIIEGAAAVAGFGLDLLTKLWNGISALGEWLWTNIVTFFTTMPLKIIEGAAYIASVGWDLLQTLWNGITSFAGWLWGNVTSFFADLPKNIIIGAAAIIGVGRDLLQKLWNGISDFGSWLWTNVKSFAENIPQKIKAGFWSIVNVGKNLVEGLWNGISDKVGWIVEKIGGWVENVKDAICNFFGIASPSKETEWMGEMVGEGLANGIEKSLSKVEKSVAKMRSGVVDGLSGIDATASAQLSTTENRNVMLSVAGAARGITTVSPQGGLFSVAYSDGINRLIEGNRRIIALLESILTETEDGKQIVVDKRVMARVVREMVAT